MRRVFISTFFLALYTMSSTVSFSQEPTGPLDEDSRLKEALLQRLRETPDLILM